MPAGVQHIEGAGRLGWWPEADTSKPTDLVRAAGKAGDQVLADRLRMEQAAATQLTTRLTTLRTTLQERIDAPGGLTDFKRFTLSELLRDVDAMMSGTQAAVISDARGPIQSAADLGDQHAEEPVRAVNVPVNLSLPGLDAQLVNAAYENTAVLLSDPMQQFRNQVMVGIRRVVLAGDGRMGEITRLKEHIAGAGFDNAVFRAERILRTEISRVFNASTYARLVALGQEFPFLLKGWRSTNDSRTRLGHRQAGATYQRGAGSIPVGQMFQVRAYDERPGKPAKLIGIARLRFPVDPQVEPPGSQAAKSATIMCRCNAFVDFDLKAYGDFVTQSVGAVDFGEPPPRPSLPPALPPATATPAPMPLPRPRKPRTLATPEATRKKLLALDAKQAASRIEMAKSLAPERERLTAIVLAVQAERDALIQRLRADPSVGNDFDRMRAHPEMVTMNARVQKTTADLAAVANKQAVFNQAQAVERRKLVQVGAGKAAKFGTAFQPDIVAQMSKESQAKVQDGIAAFKSLVEHGDEWGDYIGKRFKANQAVPVSYAPGGRSFFNAYSGVHMGTSNPAIVVHELGHAWEASSYDVHKHAVGFLAKRTQDFKAKKLKTLVPGSGYGDKEWATDDHFKDAYAGKWYTHGALGSIDQKELRAELRNKPDLYVSTVIHATEIVSMGLEQMYTDPLRFARDDPEYFDFIWNLQRRRWNALKPYDPSTFATGAFDHVPFGKGQ